ncbi:MAG: hypothetical protein ABIR18_09505 [Chitinophagaceae bacterium]
MNSDFKDTPLGTGDEERLWDYIDGISSGEEKTLIEKLLESNAQWKAKYHELLDVHQMMQSSDLEEPSMRFTKNVMDEISRLHIAPATKTYINNNVVRGIAIFFISMIVGFIIYGFGQLQLDWTSTGDSLMPAGLSKINYARFFNNTYVNSFMIVNVVLGLFLLDRYLANKRKKFHDGKKASSY